MSDVASRPLKDNFEQQSSGFTAVNGRSSPPDPPVASPRRTPPLPNGDAAHYNNYAISNKRKRSGSAEPTPAGHSQSPPRHAHPNSAYEHAPKNTAPANQDRSQSNGNGSPSESQVPRYVSPGDHQWSNQEEMINQDAHIAEALKRGTEQLSDTRQPSDQPLSPESQSHVPGSQLNQQLPGPGMIAHKQRKRNFSNRTKTGCLTCRQRKKKCDEAKPFCKNCERGNFDCLGYQNQNQTFKAPSMAPQPQLQAKNGAYFDPAAPPPQQQAPAHAPGLSAAQAQPQYGYPSRSLQPPSGPPMPPMYPGYHPAPDRDPARTRLPLGAPPPPPPPPSHETPGFIAPGSEAHPRQYHRPPWPDHPPSSYAPPPESRPVASLPSEPEPPKTLPGLPSMPGMRHGSNDIQAQFYASQSLNRLGDTRNFQASHKSNMVEGKPFWAGDAKLIEDRNYCHRILRKWNQNALDPDLWSDNERSNKFRAMLRERREAAGRHDQDREAVGENVSIGISFDCTYGYNITVGSGTQIGNACRFGDCGWIQIGKDCTIRDNVVIMSELATTMQSGGRDNREPMSKPIHIIIEDGVWIGDNVQISPDQMSLQSGTLRIGRNAHLQAGSIVVHDVSSHMDAWRTSHNGTVIKGNYVQK